MSLHSYSIGFFIHLSCLSTKSSDEFVSFFVRLFINLFPYMSLLYLITDLATFCLLLFFCPLSLSLTIFLSTVFVSYYFFVHSLCLILFFVYCLCLILFVLASYYFWSTVFVSYYFLSTVFALYYFLPTVFES